MNGPITGRQAPFSDQAQEKLYLLSIRAGLLAYRGGGRFLVLDAKFEIDRSGAAGLAKQPAAGKIVG